MLMETTSTIAAELLHAVQFTDEDTIHQYELVTKVAGIFMVFLACIQKFRVESSGWQHAYYVCI